MDLSWKVMGRYPRAFSRSVMALSRWQSQLPSDSEKTAGRVQRWRERMLHVKDTVGSCPRIAQLGVLGRQKPQDVEPDLMGGPKSPGR